MAKEIDTEKIKLQQMYEEMYHHINRVSWKKRYSSSFLYNFI